jgi:hypothetical protein
MNDSHTRWIGSRGPVRARSALGLAVCRSTRACRCGGQRDRAATRPASFDDSMLLRLDLADLAGERTVWLVATVDTHRGIVRLEDYAGEAAAAHDRALLASAPPPAPSAVTHLVPFLPVADVERSIACYGLLGFEQGDSYAPAGRSGPRCAARRRGSWWPRPRRLLTPRTGGPLLPVRARPGRPSRLPCRQRRRAGPAR